MGEGAWFVLGFLAGMFVVMVRIEHQLATIIEAIEQLWRDLERR